MRDFLTHRHSLTGSLQSTSSTNAGSAVRIGLFWEHVLGPSQSGYRKDLHYFKSQRTEKRGLAFQIWDLGKKSEAGSCPKFLFIVAAGAARYPWKVPWCFVCTGW